MATSKLQRKTGEILDKELPQCRIRENYRPDWLISPNHTKLELDFYIEELRIAFEVQGGQHFQFIPFFHGTWDNFEKRKLYDREKKDLCYGAGVVLIEIFTETDAIVAAKQIKDKHFPEINDKPVLPLPYWRKTAAEARDSIIRSPKSKKEKKEPPQPPVIDPNKKRVIDYRVQLDTDDENKSAEIEKFQHFMRKRKGKLVNPGRFRFQYLSQEEQQEALRQAGLL
jgi:hypothetical protein